MAPGSGVWAGDKDSGVTGAVLRSHGLGGEEAQREGEEIMTEVRTVAILCLHGQAEGEERLQPREAG